jgi:aminopeptidase N
MVNLKTGKDFSWFFKQYLSHRESPELLWKFYYNSVTKQNEFYFKWSNVSADFSIPIKIKTDSGLTTIYPTMQLQKVDMNKDKLVKINVEGSYIELKRSGKIIIK